VNWAPTISFWTTMAGPGAGDICWAELGSSAGSEQAGRRPVLLMSEASFHRASGLAVVCPITSNAREWPFNTLLPDGMRTRGAVLADQIRTIDREKTVVPLH
jgi:mRNA interferase MazF